MIVKLTKVVKGRYDVLIDGQNIGQVVAGIKPSGNKTGASYNHQPIVRWIAVTPEGKYPLVIGNKREHAVRVLVSLYEKSHQSLDTEGQEH